MRADLAGASRSSLAAVSERAESLFSSGTDRHLLGEELLAVTDLLDSSSALRRALSDPSAVAEAKSALVRRLLDGRVSGPTVDLVAGVVRERWSRPRDLADAVEQLAVAAILAAAEGEDRLEAVEDELFRLSRTIAGTAELRNALAASAAPAQSRAALVERLLAGRAAPETLRLAQRAAVAPRGLRAERVLEQYQEVAAARRAMLIGHVEAALPLTEEQRERLTAALRRVYGRQVQVTVDVDPALVGGLRVRVGDEVLDGSVRSRLDEAARRLAG